MGITPAQFDQMRRRTATPRRRIATPVDAIRQPITGRRPQVILGIDPSLRGTGYGIIRSRGGEAALVAAGTIKCPAGWERSRCLTRIAQDLRELIRVHVPEVCAIEGVFYAQNLQTAILLGEARGAALATIAEAGLPIHEMATRKVKQAIVGYGAAQKLAVAKMVQRLLNLTEVPEPDAADALALALAHAREQGGHRLHPPKRL